MYVELVSLSNVHRLLSSRTQTTYPELAYPMTHSQLAGTVRSVDNGTGDLKVTILGEAMTKDPRQRWLSTPFFRDFLCTLVGWLLMLSHVDSSKYI